MLLHYFYLAEQLKDLSPSVDKCAEGVKRSEAEEVLSVQEGIYVLCYPRSFSCG